MTDLSDREIAARAIYRLRPFRVMKTARVMDPLAADCREFGFDAAPAFYRDECYELADGVIADLTLAGRRRERALPARLREVA